ncbi:MAG: hypothetical protein AB7U83_04645 [Vicinamibacterales bacterium]
MRTARDDDSASSASLLVVASRGHAVKAALRVAAVVGTLLNAVNNGPQWWAQSPVSPWRVALNYLVPFLVASYSAARQEQRRRRECSTDGSRPRGEP